MRHSRRLVLAGVVATLLGLVLGLGGFAPSAAHAAPDDIVTIPDANLKAAINAKLSGHTPGQDVTEADAATVTTLTPTTSTGPIGDLTGVEALTNLASISTAVNLQGNTFTDLAPLSGLTHLTLLSLINGQIADLSPLAGISSLTALNLSNNEISDVSSLPNMPNLVTLNLSDNQIVDISSLPGKVDKAKIATINLSRNRITDGSPLVPLGTDGGKLGQWTLVSAGPVLSYNRIADFSAFSSWTKRPSSTHTFQQSLYVGPYRLGGVDLTLKSVAGVAPTVNPSTVGSYDSAQGKLTLSGDPVDSVAFQPANQWTVYFSSPPEVEDPTIPTVDGTPRTWQLLTASPGTWFGSDPCVPAYQWLSDGQPVAANKTYDTTSTSVGSGGNAYRYMVQPRDLGHRISVRVSCAGTPMASRSLETEAVTPADPEAPAIQALEGRMTRAGSETIITDARSGVVGDPTNPEIPIYVAQLNADGQQIDPADLDVTVTSLGTNYTRIFEPGDIVVEGTGAERYISLSPRSAGSSSTVTITVTGPNGKSENLYFTYWASERTSPTSRVHLGTSDPSTAIAVGDGYLLIADDERQPIRLHDATKSGRELTTFAPSSTTYSGEIDYESSARQGDKVFWLGSHGNSKDGDIEPNRHVVFETALTGTGANAKLTPVGTPYQNLRADLVDWDVANGNRFGFAAGTAEGMHPDAINGFNIEGAEFSPDGSELYLGFRSPLAPSVEGGKALIVPVENISELTGGTATKAEFGEPILLDLDGQSIREIRKNEAGEYLIIGGIANGSHYADTQSLWVWDGDPDTAPMRLANALPPSIPAMSVDAGSWEGIGELPAHLEVGSKVRLLMDQGYGNLYGTGENKDDTNAFTRKSRSDEMVLESPTVTTVGIADPGDFPDQPANTIGAPQTITVTNTGWNRLNDLTIGATDLEDDDGESLDDFLISRNTCEGTELTFGGTCQVRVRFAPARTETTSHARLSVVVNGETRTVPLTGTSIGLPEGDDGADGTPGDKGDAGDKGDTGDKGDAGDPGADGGDGADGKDGANGRDGVDGKAGPQGPAGPAGKPGTFAFAAKAKSVSVRRGQTVRLSFVAQNGTAAKVAGATATATVPKALKVSGSRSVKITPLKAGQSHNVVLKLKVKKATKVGSHKVKVRLKVAGRSVTRTITVRVTR